MLKVSHTQANTHIDWAGWLAHFEHVYTITKRLTSEKRWN